MSAGSWFWAEGRITRVELGAGHPKGPNPARSWVPERESQGGTQELQILSSPPLSNTAHGAGGFLRKGVFYGYLRRG